VGNDLLGQKLNIRSTRRRKRLLEKNDGQLENRLLTLLPKISIRRLVRNTDLLPMGIGIELFLVKSPGGRMVNLQLRRIQMGFPSLKRPRGRRTVLKMMMNRVVRKKERYKPKGKRKLDPRPRKDQSRHPSKTLYRLKSPQAGSKTPGDKSRSRKRAHVSESGESEDEDIVPVKKATRGNKNNNRSKSRKSTKEWVVPDSSDESTDELQYMREKGLTIIHDYWPSPWRVMAAAFVNTERINKSVSSQT
jgi:hypothetical protein